MADIKDDIEKYLRGELTPSERYALEKKALSDPFIADALEGAESISAADFSKDLSQLNQQLQSKGRKTIWFTPLRIAAGVALLIGSIFIIYNLNEPEEQLALQKSKAPATETADSLVNNDKSNLLSLNQPKDQTKSETEGELKKENVPSVLKPNERDQANPTGGLSTSTQTAPVIATDENELAKADETKSAELVEIATEEKELQAEKIAAAEPSQQDLKREAITEDLAGRAKAKKSITADDLVLTNKKQTMINGQVTSLEDGLPLPGVNVTIKGTTIGTVTDAQGNYTIPLESEKQKLIFSFIGLQTSEVSPDLSSSVNVKLQEDVSQLSEVVVTGQGFKIEKDENDSPVIKLAEPFGGRKAYDKYLENNLRYPQQALENKVKGKVTISFTVGTDGSLRDFNVMKSLGYGCDDEVIRLVKEGPKWYPSTEDNIAIESGVRVKMKFDPQKVKK